MDNKAIANILYETADLMEVRGDDSFRIRSYRRAGEAIDTLPQPVSEIIGDRKAILAIPGIGKAMCANLEEIVRDKKLHLHQELLTHYRPTMLELLKVQGLGPKTISLLWDAFQVSDIAGVEKLAREGKLRDLPKMGPAKEAKILSSIEGLKRISGRYLIDKATEQATVFLNYLSGTPGIDTVTLAGSLRRGRETIGDLDILVTGKGCCDEERQAVTAKILGGPGVMEVINQGSNKISFRLRNGMQVDVRLIPPESFGAALQYFTGSKSHNVALRQRALKLGYTLNEYGLVRIKDQLKMAGASEQELYAKLNLSFIPPELRENNGEIDAAHSGLLPLLVSEEDIQGDVHMHTVATDGRSTILEMAQAAKDRGYQYIAITDHSKALAFANGLDDKRALEHIRAIREANRCIEGLRIFTGIEVDILADGELDLSHSVLEEMEVVIASVHSHFQQEPARMTERLLRVLDSGVVSVIGHPTGRKLLRREAYSYDMDAVLKQAARAGVAMELNSYPDRLDLCDLHLRMAKERGVKIVINTDSHHTSHLRNLQYGILQARRAWLSKGDVLNTRSPKEFAAALNKKS